MEIFADRALVEDQWIRNLRLDLSEGLIRDIQFEASAKPGDYRVDTLLPALSNLHSHSFQRAMAGMTEFRAHGRESFWTWRDLMYRFLEHLTPQHIGAIAELAFMEMLKSGYAAVGEFHYVHHQAGGAPYGDLAELSARIMQAAKSSGIGLMHLPVLYTYAGISKAPLAGGQLRFGNDADRFQELVERCKTLARDMPEDTQVGIAPHSLRAISAEDLSLVVELNDNCPVHIHIAEQIKEVEEIKTATGRRPVEWLLSNMAVDARWCLIHATHMTSNETKALARSGAVAGLCPVTEANLGDGIFNGQAYLDADGIYGIGTDSNVNIALTEELRAFEYSQRLKEQSRNVLAGAEKSTGFSLYTCSAQGGAQALDRNAGSIAIGKLADLVAIDTSGPRLCALEEHQLLDGLIFGANDGVITDAWSAGRHMVQGGRHTDEEAIFARYQKTMRSLSASL